MSILSEITRIQNGRNTIRTKLVSMGIVTASTDLDDCASALSSLDTSLTYNSSTEELTIPDWMVTLTDE